MSWTYKKVDGYEAILAYLGKEGYWINVELRDGKQHCQKGTQEFPRKAIGLAKQIISSPLLVRMDSGNDSLDNIRVFHEENVDWLIKRNLRQKSV